MILLRHTVYFIRVGEIIFRLYKYEAVTLCLLSIEMYFTDRIVEER